MNYIEYAALNEATRAIALTALVAPDAIATALLARSKQYSALLETATKVESPKATTPLESILNWGVPIPQANGFAALIFKSELNPWTFKTGNLIAGLGGARRVFVGIDSPGGDSTIALDLFDALQGREVEVEISGNAFSSAAILAMAGQRRRIARDGWMMVHSPVVFTSGTPARLRHEADRLEKTFMRFADILERATGQRRAVVEGWMDGNNHWFNATDSVLAGLATEIYDPPSIAVASGSETPARS